MLKKNIQEYRSLTQDNSWFEHFEYLHNYARKFSKKKKTSLTEKTEEEIKKFISEELEVIDCDYKTLCSSSNAIMKDMENKR